VNLNALRYNWLTDYGFIESVRRLFRLRQESGTLILKKMQMKFK
jgi:hypothetical protein